MKNDLANYRYTPVPSSAAIRILGGLFLLTVLIAPTQATPPETPPAITPPMPPNPIQTPSPPFNGTQAGSTRMPYIDNNIPVKLTPSINMKVPPCPNNDDSKECTKSQNQENQKRLD